MGIVLWEIVARRKPFNEPEDRGVKDWTLREEIIGGKRPPIPAALDASYQQLMTACWESEPDQRPTASVTREHLQRMCMEHPPPARRRLQTLHPLQGRTPAIRIRKKQSRYEAVLVEDSSSEYSTR